MIGVYNGDPARPHCQGDPQVCNNNGLDSDLDDPPLLMAEGAYKYNQDRLAGTIKFGGWNHFGNFEHQRFDFGGALIAVTGQSRPAASTTIMASTASSTSSSGACRAARTRKAWRCSAASSARRRTATSSTSMPMAASPLPA